LVESLEHRAKIGRGGGGVLRLSRRGQGEAAQSQGEAGGGLNQAFHVE
jgi:hypothetical protein